MWTLLNVTSFTLQNYSYEPFKKAPPSIHNSHILYLHNARQVVLPNFFTTCHLSSYSLTKMPVVLVSYCEKMWVSRSEKFFWIIFSWFQQICVQVDSLIIMVTTHAIWTARNHQKKIWLCDQLHQKHDGVGRTWVSRGNWNHGNVFLGLCHNIANFAN